MPELFDPTLAEMIQEIEREITMRRAVYPGLIAKQRITQNRADRQILVMQSILDNLRDQQE